MKTSYHINVWILLIILTAHFLFVSFGCRHLPTPIEPEEPGESKWEKRRREHERKFPPFYDCKTNTFKADHYYLPLYDWTGGVLILEIPMTVDMIETQFIFNVGN